MSTVFEWLHAQHRCYALAVIVIGYVWIRYALSKHDNVYDALVQPWKDWVYARRERRWLAKQPKPKKSPYRA